MSKAVAKKEETGSVVEVMPQRSSGAMTPMEMLNAAMERGDGIDKLERLMDLNDRWEKAQAKKAFLEAKAAFKANAPTILKDKENKQYGSRYSSIGNVVNTVNEALSRHGLDAQWDYDQGEKTIKVTCILSHPMGHSERVSLAGPPDVSGAKNPIQQIKSTTTYLKLATFEAVTGIATSEGNKDDDGNGAASAEDAPITEEQIADLKKRCGIAKLTEPKFLAYIKCDSFEDIRVSQFERACTAITNYGRKALTNG
jgi:hypothetical protein